MAVSRKEKKGETRSRQGRLLREKLFVSSWYILRVNLEGGGNLWP